MYSAQRGCRCGESPVASRHLRSAVGALRGGMKGAHVRLFATPAVKELRKQAGFIGSLYGSLYSGAISAADVASIVEDPGYRSELRAAYESSVSDVGERKSLKEAIASAEIWAAAPAKNRGDGYGNISAAAKRAVCQMLDIG